MGWDLIWLFLVCWKGDGMVDAIDVAAQNGRIIMYGCVGLCKRTIDFFKVHRRRLEILSIEPRRDIDNCRFLNCPR